MQAGTTVLTIGELILFGRDILAAFNEESENNVPNKNNNTAQKDKTRSWGFLLARAAIVAGAQAFTTHLINRYYENVIQKESLSWYILTKAFYKINGTELKQHLVALQDAKDNAIEIYQRHAVISSAQGLMKQLEKIIAFMEYKTEHINIKNRPEARSLTKHLEKMVAAFAESFNKSVRDEFNTQDILVSLANLESIIDRESLSFFRLEGATSLSEQQYNALVQAQGV